MSKQAPPPPAESASPFVAYLVIGLVFGAVFGSTITWILMRQQAPAVAPAPSGGGASDPGLHLPPPDLTAGQTPAQAERTLGNFYYDHQNWPQAIAHYEGALQQGADDADVRTDLGNALRFSGRPQEALAQYEAAQKLNPAHEFSLFNQGGLYLEELKQPAKAIAVWQQYLARFPSGRNVDAARALIAQAGGGAPAPAPGAPAANPAASGTEDLILRQIQAGQSEPRKP